MDWYGREVCFLNIYIDRQSYKNYMHNNICTTIFDGKKVQNKKKKSHCTMDLKMQLQISYWIHILIRFKRIIEDFHGLRNYWKDIEKIPFKCDALIIKKIMWWNLWESIKQYDNFTDKKNLPKNILIMISLRNSNLQSYRKSLEMSPTTRIWSKWPTVQWKQP